VEHALGRVAEPEAVDQGVAGQAIQRTQPDGHAALGEIRHIAILTRVHVTSNDVNM